MAPIARDNQLKTPYTVLDTDPHATRVIKYMRPADYAVWAGMTAAAPLAFYGLELADPSKMTRAGLRPALRLTAFLGFTGGFLLAYQTSSRQYPNLAVSQPSRRPACALQELTRPSPLSHPCITIRSVLSIPVRLWGWKDNLAEEKAIEQEMTALAKAGKPLYGEQTLPPYIQGVAHRNSIWSQLKFGVMPWFNFVRHPHHGVDVSKYETSKDE
ncbi:BZ3500_MvSof-1268-A1-R1_Chr2-2g04942 [Microbotryum saponariae]|uniref:BZ3500_MvSof-1268-A1-R1_Chr2-2g04942 protein n=1 Tax=Microbotryum saponariae TaxID=289078 RepID=A0A2X0KAF9_9BASI|nr:BZ3500_MvSof-1268-A1-R1_Chr2-2g04942 [Microbotryum saponariae]SDA00529.1 BZ3501_MvSof-1269-A2-R1_Chr2-2g04616 [Microbotryum saponariae]